MNISVTVRGLSLHLIISRAVWAARGPHGKVFAVAKLPVRQRLFWAGPVFFRVSLLSATA